MVHQCYICEQIFDSSEKLFEHLAIHSDTTRNPKLEEKKKELKKKLESVCKFYDIKKHYSLLQYYSSSERTLLIIPRLEMTMTYKNRNFAMCAILITALAFVALEPSNAFAATYSPNWSDPGSCTGSSNECANASSNGENTAVAKAIGAFTLREADAHNNRDSSNSNPGSNPEISVTGSVQKDYKIDYKAKGYESYATGATGGLEIYVQAWRNHENNGWEPNGFSGVVYYNSCSGTCTHDSTLTAGRTSTGAGNHDLRVSGYHHVWALNTFWGGTTTIDYWNAADREVTTQELCIETTCN